MKQKTAGRPKDFESIERVKKYLAMGLLQSEVARVMSKDPVQILRWVRYIKAHEDKVRA